MHPAPGAHAFSPDAVRRAIEDLACTAPAQVGWAVTHWSQHSLAAAAGELAYVESIHQTTVGDILRAADLQPHRVHAWKTAVWDDEAVARALKILWYYERTDSLWRRGEVVLCVDEKPNIQVLERARPIQRMSPGQIERQEFEYIRHGTVNLLVGLTVHNGRMWSECLEQNDGAHFRPALRRLFHPYGWAKCIHVVMDNGPSHVSGDTVAFFEALDPRVHVLLTPTHASWLNQAESLLEAFGEHYLLRGSWSSRPDMLQHLSDSEVHYNGHFAHPFEWDWSCRAFRFWLNNTPGLIRCNTLA